MGEDDFLEAQYEDRFISDLDHNDEVMNMTYHELGLEANFSGDDSNWAEGEVNPKDWIRGEDYA